MQSEFGESQVIFWARQFNFVETCEVKFRIDDFLTTFVSKWSRRWWTCLDVLHSTWCCIYLVNVDKICWRVRDHLVIDSCRQSFDRVMLLSTKSTTDMSQNSRQESLNLVDDVLYFKLDMLTIYHIWTHYNIYSTLFSTALICQKVLRCVTCKGILD